jgi:hypothetical protein
VVRPGEAVDCKEADLPVGRLGPIERFGDYRSKWMAVRHSGAWLKIERKSQRIFQLFHYDVGKLADLAFETHS